MSDEIVFDVLCTKVLDALRALGLGKFSISRLTQSSVRRTQTLSLVTCLVGYLVTELQPAINGSGMRMTEWE